MPETLRVEVDEAGVAVVTLDRPGRRNAWNARMGFELSDAMARCDGDDDIRAVVVTGAGDVFCVGADLEGADQFAGRSGDDDRATPKMVLPWMISKPVVAAINGHAVGVGITYPLTCDLRFVAEEAKVAFAFVRRGALPELASHVLLPRVVGLSTAADLLLSGRTISGREAAELGLASRALPAADVLPAALAWARDVATAAAPVSVAAAKRLLWRGLGETPDAMLEIEEPLFAWFGDQPDVREGITSFLERRPPRWSMRPSRDVPPWS